MCSTEGGGALVAWPSEEDDAAEEAKEETEERALVKEHRQREATNEGEEEEPLRRRDRLRSPTPCSVPTERLKLKQAKLLGEEAREGDLPSLRELEPLN